MQSSAQSGSYTTQEEQQPPAGGHTIHQSYQQVYDDFESYAFVEDPTFKVGMRSSLGMLYIISRMSGPETKC